jgi:hypothetical protein
MPSDAAVAIGPAAVPSVAPPPAIVTREKLTPWLAITKTATLLFPAPAAPAARNTKSCTTSPVARLLAVSAVVVGELTLARRVVLYVQSSHANPPKSRTPSSDGLIDALITTCSE